MLVRFNVSKPLRRSKVVNLPKGGSAKILFEYERVQKCCYFCQRLTHDQETCPLSIKKGRERAATRRERGAYTVHKMHTVIEKDDPRFGVLSDNQVGIDHLTGRPRIAEEVLQEI